MVDLIKKHIKEVVNETWNNANRCEDVKDEIMNAALGLAGEAGEVVDVLKKMFYHRPKNRRDELMVEMGDVYYYMGKLQDLFGFTTEEILEANKVKLFERYEVEGK
ncbi:hypothetical protein KW807_02770 [Candidatus Parcubacteria bacterium]|nr:hypothetical protein [Candidatus Parcubacteria bacterium]